MNLPLWQRILRVSGLVCLAFPSLTFILWQYASGVGKNQAQRVQIYHSFFPEFLNEPFVVTLVSLGFCALGVLLSAISLFVPGITWKVLNIVNIAILGLLTLLYLFWLM
ncbi:MAG: hypothetical protein JNL57_05050 [Bacteroidetes bacterium]|nr:hypothetical protein [Bacteroidota bacterium]